MKFFFYSGMSGSPWGGSEDLWSRSALRLVQNGHQVAACVKEWPIPARQINELAENGVELIYRRQEVFGLLSRITNKISKITGIGEVQPTVSKFQHALLKMMPDLLIVSQGSITDGLVAMEVANDAGMPYVSLVQANSESFWPNDELADKLLRAASDAKKNFFVAKANQDLFFRQIGKKLDNCAVVHNPPNPSAQRGQHWPPTDVELSLACVARLDVIAKGQDILFEVLAQPQWQARRVRVHLYGSGMNERSLRRHAQTLGIESKVVFEGQVSDVGKIWQQHHALVLPSRFEGTPLSLIEAMRCARPGICTAVAGIPELIDDGVSGFLASAPTIPLFALCMERAWNSRHELKAMGEAAYQAVNQKVSVDPVEDFVNQLKVISQVSESKL